MSKTEKEILFPLQSLVLEWAVDNFGEVAANRDERAARLVEEAIEIAQVEGLSTDLIENIMHRVYSKPVGDCGQEIGGVAICLAAYAQCVGKNVAVEIRREWKRVLSKPKEWWQKKHSAKVAAGTADVRKFTKLQDRSEA